VPVREPVVGLAPSPDGRALALSGKEHLFLHNCEHPEDQLPQIAIGKTREVVWSANSENFAALFDDQVFDVAMLPTPRLRNRKTAQGAEFLAHRADGVYVIIPSGVALMSRGEDGDAPDPRNARKPHSLNQLQGDPVGLAEARGKTIVA